jgi:hypothetical protein
MMFSRRNTRGIGSSHERRVRRPADERKKEMAIELKLEKEDAAVLQQVLEVYLSELRFEIPNTDSFQLRAGLHEQKDRIERMLASLKGEDASSGVAAPAER